MIQFEREFMPYWQPKIFGYQMRQVLVKDLPVLELQPKQPDENGNKRIGNTVLDAIYDDNAQVDHEDMAFIIWYFSENRTKTITKELLELCVENDAEILMELKRYLTSNLMSATVYLETSKPRARVASSTAVRVHNLASQYGWSLEQCLNTPMAVYNQLLDVANQTAGSKITTQSEQRRIGAALDEAEALYGKPQAVEGAVS